MSMMCNGDILCQYNQMPLKHLTFPGCDTCVIFLNAAVGLIALLIFYWCLIRVKGRYSGKAFRAEKKNTYFRYVFILELNHICRSGKEKQSSRVKNVVLVTSLLNKPQYSIVISITVVKNAQLTTAVDSNRPGVKAVCSFQLWHRADHGLHFHWALPRSFCSIFMWWLC